jgi:ribosomal protein S18 acetylase RimI-like enzyme
MADSAPPPILAEMTIRPAVPADLDRVADIINDPPATGSIALAGSVEKAIRAGRVFAHFGISPLLQHTVVAEIDGQVVAVMDASADHPEVEFTVRLFLRLLVPVLRTVGAAGLLRFLRSRGAWGRVGFPNDHESYYIAELDVDSAHRNRGIGGVLLRHAEEQARAAGCPRMTLTTNVTNPAQHLYERFGFHVSETKTDAEYERYSGSPGRVLMVKDLG